MIARRESDGGSSSQAQALRSFASYIERVLKAIKDNLEQKSKLYEESKALKGISWKQRTSDIREINFDIEVQFLLEITLF